MIAIHEQDAPLCVVKLDLDMQDTRALRISSRKWNELKLGVGLCELKALSLNHNEGRLNDTCLIDI
jgi:predicted aspartyl protease